ncbi:hypothetical protein HPB52_013858 [Rhipicephalus sanguineus]|uniref:Chitin-binding type-2 domain-containing protein n=1 Tax=Rhipicephalus sanguineus TaxID=34632 RepID=A0A9D4PNV7_RHISA|nr:hypothetical protein HPB52_013858 [Rhipicephalus sanguineus]
MEVRPNVTVAPMRRPTNQRCGFSFYTYCTKLRHEAYYRHSTHSCVLTITDDVQVCNHSPNKFATLGECQRSCVHTRMPSVACLEKPLFSWCGRHHVNASWWVFDGRNCRPWNFPAGVSTCCAGQRKGKSALPTIRPIGTAPAISEIPITEFRCSNQEFPGYFADVETDCQVYHNCLADGRNSSFLCVNGTIFNQRNFVCDWWYKFDCRKAPSFYHLNLLRNKKNGTKAASTEGALPAAPKVLLPAPPPPRQQPSSKRYLEKEARTKPSSSLTSRYSKPSSKPPSPKTPARTPAKASPKTHESLILLPFANIDSRHTKQTTTTAATTRERSSRGRAQMRVFAKIKDGQEPAPRTPKSKTRTKTAKVEVPEHVMSSFSGDADRHQNGGGFQEWTSIGAVSGRPSVTRVQFHTFSANPPRFDPPLPQPAPQPAPVVDPASWLDDDFNREPDAGVEDFRGEVEDGRSQEEQAPEGGTSTTPQPEVKRQKSKSSADDVVRLAKALPSTRRQTANGGWRGKKEAFPGLQDKKRLFYRFQPSEPFGGYGALSYFGRMRGPMNDLSRLPRLVSVKLNKVERKEPEYAIKPLLLSVKLDQSSEVDYRTGKGAPPGLCFCPCH